MRTLPLPLWLASLQAQTGERVFTFITFTVDITDYAYVNNTEAVTRDSVSHLAHAFEVVLPSSQEKGIGDGSLTIDNVDRGLTEALRTSVDPIEVTVAIALFSDPDDSVNIGTFQWKNISYDAFSVTGSLTYEDRLDVLTPYLIISPNNVPGSF